MQRCRKHSTAGLIYPKLLGQQSNEPSHRPDTPKKKSIPYARNTIEIVFQNFDNIWALEVLRGVLQESQPANVAVTVTVSGDRRHPDSSWARGILQRRPLGAILIFSNLTAVERSMLSARNIPFVIFDPSGDPYPSDFSIQADNWTGGIIATRHLVSLKHKRIGVITGPDEMLCSKARFDGYAAALSEGNIPLDSNLVMKGNFTTESGYQQTMLMLSNKDRPTAIFAENDLEAMGVYEAARQMGLRIPEDLSVIGFDDLQTAAFMGPALTTIHQPLSEMASRAAHIILTGNSFKPEVRHIIMPTSLIVRKSTMPHS